MPLLTKVGLEILAPAYFLTMTCVICAIISIFTGTSWGTVGTIGLALPGIGESMGIPLYITAGAIVSGAWFGDKMSPLSDTTNFAAAIVGTNLYAHIRNMLPTTVPAMLIALVVYYFLGNMHFSGELDANNVEELDRVLTQTFDMNLWLLLPPAVIALSIWRKVEPMPGMFMGVVAASFVAFVIQDASFGEIMRVMMSGYESSTGNPQIDKLLSKGGILSMTWVITLIMIAMVFGGALEKTGCLDAILSCIIGWLKNRFSLVFATAFSTLLFNFASNAFIAYTVPGRMLAPAFRGNGYHTANVSRLLEDSATMSAPLIPWNSGAVFVSGTLGVPTVLYAPFAISNWMVPIIDLFWGLTGWFLPKASEQEIQRWIDNEELYLFKGHIVTATTENTVTLLETQHLISTKS